MKLRHRVPYATNYFISRFRGFIFPSFPVERVTADFYVSIGGNCRTATQLRRNKLRICSSPLDWMMEYSLDDAATLFEDGFQHFFSDIRERPHGDGAHNRVIEDARNGMISVHHFPVSMTIEEGRNAYKKKSKKQFNNTHSYMASADHFVMVTNRTEGIESICGFICRMQALYKAKMTHINIRCTGEGKREIVNVGGGAVLYDYSFDDVNFNEKQGIADRSILGNDPEWRRILGACRRTDRYFHQNSTPRIRDFE